jgi:hypothetical protein
MKTIIPAQPGFFALQNVTYVHGAEPARFFRLPVIAWAVEADGLPTPITPEGPDDNAAILMPDGSVLKPCIESWNSEAEYLRSLQERKAQEEGGAT